MRSRFTIVERLMRRKWSDGSLAASAVTTSSSERDNLFMAVSIPVIYADILETTLRQGGEVPTRSPSRGWRKTEPKPASPVTAEDSAGYGAGGEASVRESDRTGGLSEKPVSKGLGA